jgi:isopenicillin N synthase-like dioxygenase
VEANAGSHGRDTPPDLRESFTFGPEEVPPAVDGTAEQEWFGPNSWPTGRPELQAAATAFSTGCGALAEDLLRIFALALDLDDDFFVSRCTDNNWSVRLTWYPARPAVGSVRPGQLLRGRMDSITVG